MKSNAPRALTLMMALVLAGCADQPELHFADWVFPVAEGVPIKEYAPVPLEDRSEDAFELVEDLVIGGDPNDANTAFYRPIAVVAAGNGNIFVVENGGKRVQMFASDGAFLKTLGQEGQGPGEFQMPSEATIAGEHLVIFDAMGRRFSVWTDEGEHVADHAAEMTAMPTRMAGLADGGILATVTEFDLSAMISSASSTSRMPATTTVLASYGDQFEQLARLLETVDPPMPSPDEVMNDARARTQLMIDRFAAPRMAFAVGGARAVYVTPTTEYQVLAMTPEGEVRWALRVAWDRRPYPEATKESLVSALARSPVAQEEEPQGAIDDFVWPEFDRAISSDFRSDGQGRLYVYPLYPRSAAEDTKAEEDAPEDEETDERPRSRAVDVYSPEGDLIVAGLASGTWSYGRGDYVYDLRRDPDSDELQVVRFRLVLNPR